MWLLKKIWILKPTHILTFLNRFSLIAIISKLILFFSGRKVKVILSEEIFTSNYIKQYEKFYWKFIISLTYRFADKIYVLTKAMKDDLVNNFLIPRDLIQILFSWTPVQNDRNKKKEFSVIFAGRLSEEKRIFMILDLAKEIKRLELGYKIIIAGDGVLRNKVIAKIKKYKLNSVIKYLGYRNDVIDLMKKSKLLLLPSKNEGLPMVVLEANSVGIPVSVTNFEGCEELIKNGKNGWIFFENEFISETISLLSNDKKLRCVGKTAKLLIEQEYSLKNAVIFVKGMFI